MKFIIDGNGEISHRAARELLADIMHPYQSVEFVTEVNGVLSTHVLDVLNSFRDLSYVVYNVVPELQSELGSDKDKVYIVLDPASRKDHVNYCIDNNIQVLDLEKGLYPVTEKIS